MCTREVPFSDIRDKPAVRSTTLHCSDTQLTYHHVGNRVRVVQHKKQVAQISVIMRQKGFARRHARPTRSRDGIVISVLQVPARNKKSTARRFIIVKLSTVTAKHVTKLESRGFCTPPLCCDEERYKCVGESYYTSLHHTQLKRQSQFIHVSVL